MFKCRNSTNPNATVCADSQSIDRYFNDKTFSFGFVNTYFDFNDFTDPIKYFIDDSMFYEVESSKHKKANVFVQK